jgi:glc operon protein GlcG
MVRRLRLTKTKEIAMKILNACLIATMTIFFVLSSTATAQNEQLAQKKAMTLAVAKRIVAAAEIEACKPPCSGALAVVDEGGNLIFEETLDNTISPSIQLAIEKARTAALYHRPTQTFHESVAQAKNLSYQDGSFPSMTTAVGGVPLIVDGKVIGGFGISGHGEETDPITNAALAAFAKIAAH